MRDFTSWLGRRHFWKTSSNFLLFFLLSSSLSSAVCAEVLAAPTEVQVEKWITKNFAKGKTPPFSFVYGGNNSATFITKWRYKAEILPESSTDVVRRRFTYSDPKSGLVVSCDVSGFAAFQAVEWVLNFTNSGKIASPVLEKVLVVNRSFGYEKAGDVILHHSKGGDVKRSDFMPADDTLATGKNLYLTPARGRSSDETALPFFNIETASEQGIVVAIGWTGKWFADVRHPDPKVVELQSGMEKMKLSLNATEEIRTPRICLLFWQSKDRMRGHNQFRQFILAHHSRKIDGKFAEYPLSGGFNWGDPPPCNEYSCLTEDYAISLVNRYKQFGIVPEVFWLDAGWYTGCGAEKGGEWYANVGNWTVDKTRFPNGLKPIADAVHKVGAKFMLWFEPERVRPGTQFATEHPEWMMKVKKGDFLFNLGDKNARTWLTDYISDFIRKEGVDYYRQDFNMDPMPYWEANDAPDRIGMSEIRHVEGLYAFWDSLLVRFPNLLIDNCASGGRRLDLETTSRSAPLWRTDYHYGEPNGYQSHTYGLNFYLPLHGTGVFAKADPLTFRSSLSSALVLNWKITGNQVTIPEMQKCVADYKRLRPYYYGDYYPLTHYQDTTLDSIWLAYQMNRTGERDGIIVAFRRADSKDESIQVKFSGLENAANYELLDEDSGKKSIVKGEDLMKGYTLSLTKPGSLLISYKLIP